MSLRLDDTVAVITGASSGIGAATARALAEHGAHVALLARRADRLADLADEITQHNHGKAVAYSVDVADADAVRDVMTRVAADFGRIDILVNGAGVGTWAPALEAELADWQAMVDVNVSGVLNTTHAALAHLVSAADGPRGIADVVTISSIAGKRVPGPNSNVYSATKFAVNGFSEALRQELGAKHVRMGLIEPGLVTTEMTTTGETYAPDTTQPTGLGYLAPEDVADAVAYMITRPRHAAVNEIAIRPTEQSN